MTIFLSCQVSNSLGKTCQFLQHSSDIMVLNPFTNLTVLPNPVQLISVLFWGAQSAWYTLDRLWSAQGAEFLCSKPVGPEVCSVHCDGVRDRWPISFTIKYAQETLQTHIPLGGIRMYIGVLMDLSSPVHPYLIWCFPNYLATKLFIKVSSINLPCAPQGFGWHCFPSIYTIWSHLFLPSVLYFLLPSLFLFFIDHSIMI